MWRQLHKIDFCLMTRGRRVANVVVNTKIGMSVHFHECAIGWKGKFCLDTNANFVLGRELQWLFNRLEK